MIIVPDSILRIVPFAALYDKEKGKYLIENYALVTMLGFTLTNPQPSILAKNTTVFLGGISEQVQNFEALLDVDNELEEIQRIFSRKGSTQTEKLLNHELTTQKIESKLKTTYHHIIHFSTHGEFNKVPEKSFLLTFDGKLGMNQLEKSIASTQFSNQPIELLAFSACETARSGKHSDERAALGLAGITIKTGAKNAVAGLWKVESKVASILFPKFYEELLLEDKSTSSKAKALQKVQNMFLNGEFSQERYRKPLYWAPFLLIGNWY